MANQAWASKVPHTNWTISRQVWIRRQSISTRRGHYISSTTSFSHLIRWLIMPCQNSASTIMIATTYSKQSKTTLTKGEQADSILKRLLGIFPWTRIRLKNTVQVSNFSIFLWLKYCIILSFYYLMYLTSYCTNNMIWYNISVSYIVLSM